MGKRSKFPLDDPSRWFALTPAIERRAKLTGETEKLEQFALHKPLAITDTEDRLRSDKLHLMRIHRATGKREPLGPDFMRDHEMVVWPIVGVMIHPRTPPPTGGVLHLPQWRERDTQHDYFVWKPELDALLGIASGGPATSSPQRKRKAKPRKPDPTPPPPAPATANAGPAGTEAARQLADGYEAMAGRHSARRSATAKRR